MTKARQFPGGTGRTTMQDVAQLAGVSQQTVSRVINGAERVAPETVERVERAIEKLGFGYEAVRARTGPIDRLHIEATGALSHSVSITTRGDHTVIVSKRAMPTDKLPDCNPAHRLS